MLVSGEPPVAHKCNRNPIGASTAPAGLGKLCITVGMELGTLTCRWVIFNLQIIKTAVFNFDSLLPPVFKLILALARCREEVAPNNFSAIAYHSDKLDPIISAVG